MIARHSLWDAWLPGGRSFAAMMLFAVVWWVALGLGLEWITA
jgi:hypothetical protein